MSYFGIDLGTTNSCLARYDEQRKCAVVITNNDESAQTIASVVAFSPDDDNTAYVGKCAQAVMEDCPERGIKLVKRYMGSDDYVLELKEGAKFRPHDISTFILKKIMKYGAATTGEEIKDAVVTVPAYFGYREREATRKAAEAAGLNLRALIDEPTAAALSYFQDYSSLDPLTVFVYDLGGGTFDVSAVRMTFSEDGKQSVEVLTFAGNHRLGGSDWDRQLCTLITEKVKAELQQRDPSLSLSDNDISMIMNKTEEIKMRLTSMDTTTFKGTFSGARINVPVTREEFEACTSGLMDQTKTLCKAVLDHPTMKDVHVDKVLLVGGSSLMPMVRNMMRDIFPDPDVEIKLSEPHHSVAKGACIACYMGLGDTPVFTDPSNDPGPEPPHGPEVIPVVPKSVGFRLFDKINNTRYIDTRIFRGEKMTDNGHLQITIDDYGPVRDNLPCVTVAAYELNNDDVNSRRVNVNWADNTFQTVKENDNPYGIRYMGELVLPLEPGTPAHAHLRLIVDVSTTGLRLECYNLDTNGEHHDVTLNMVSKVNTDDVEQYGLE